MHSYTLTVQGHPIPASRPTHLGRLGGGASEYTVVVWPRAPAWLAFSNRGEAHLELNAFRRKHDCALVISGDSLEVLQHNTTQHTATFPCTADDAEDEAKTGNREI